MDPGLVHPAFGPTTYVVLVTTCNNCAKLYSASIESVTNSLKEANMTRDAIIENRWRLGEKLLWESTNNYLFAVDILAMSMV